MPDAFKSSEKFYSLICQALFNDLMENNKDGINMEFTDHHKFKSISKFFKST